MSYRWIFAVLVAGLFVAGSAFARGKKIDRSELPPAVERGVAVTEPRCRDQTLVTRK